MVCNALWPPIMIHVLRKPDGSVVLFIYFFIFRQFPVPLYFFFFARQPHLCARENLRNAQTLKRTTVSKSQKHKACLVLLTTLLNILSLHQWCHYGFLHTTACLISTSFYIFPWTNTLTIPHLIPRLLQFTSYTYFGHLNTQHSRYLNMWNTQVCLLISLLLFLLILDTANICTWSAHLFIAYIVAFCTRCAVCSFWGPFIAHYRRLDLLYCVPLCTSLPDFPLLLTPKNVPAGRLIKCHHIWPYLGVQPWEHYECLFTCHFQASD